MTRVQDQRCEATLELCANRTSLSTSRRALSQARAPRPLDVASSRIIPVGNKAALLLRRFDRDGARRIPFLSAMSMLGAADNEQHSYLEIVEAIRRYGTKAALDCAQLWRRAVFNILISNTDDHLRNHGFLYGGIEGWSLSPAYDLNPVPVDIKPRILSTAIDSEDPSASIDLAFANAGRSQI